MSKFASLRQVRRRACALSLSVSLAAIIPAAFAAGAPSYGDLLRQALSNAPALLEQAASVQAAGAEARQARARPNPSFSALAENLRAPQNNGESQRQGTFAVTQAFETGGKRGARIEAGERGLAAAEARERQTRVTFAANLAVAYATAEAAQQRKALTADELTRANDDLRAARALVQAGKEAALRVAQASASVAAAQAGEQAAAADAIEALERLSALAGSTETYTVIDKPFLTGAGAYRPSSGSAPGDAPAVARAAAERDALASQARFEEKRWMPDIGVTAGTRSYGWTGGNGLIVGVTMAIPLFDRNEGNIEAARQRAVAADARLQTARLEATANKRSALAQVAAAGQRVEASMQGETAAAEAYRLGRIGYEGGKTSLFELLAIRRSLAEAKALTIDARLARVRALAALSVADGQIAFGETK